MMIVLVDEIERDLGAVHGHIMVACISTTNINHQLLYAKIAHTLVFFFSLKYTKPESTRLSLLCYRAPELRTKTCSHHGVGRIKTMWYVYKVKYYSAMKRTRLGIL